MDVEFVVVGAGLAGAATAWQLARTGHEVMLLERRRPATRDGSSHGSARIFRYAYDDPAYAALVVRARAGFDELERLAGRELVCRTGALDFGIGRDPRALAAVLATVGVEHEVISRQEARRRFPGIRFDTEVLWHPTAGVLDAESTVNALVALARAGGAQLQSDWCVQRITRTTTGFAVHGDQGRQIDARRVVVAAGGWLPFLLDRLPMTTGQRARLPRLEVSQEYAYHFPYADPVSDDGEVWPTFIHKRASMQTYGLPGGRDAGFRGQKIAEFNAGRKLASAVAQDGRIDPANRERIVGYVRDQLPGLVPEPYAETTCLFTNTPNQDFVIDELDGLTLVSACSGHGAKFGPLIGELAAAAATGAPGVPDRFRLAAAG